MSAIVAPPCADPMENVLSRLEGKKKSNNGGHVARCPAHDDKHASLGIDRGHDGRVLLNCHAGCNVVTIVRRIGLSLSDLFPADHPYAIRAQGRFMTAEAAAEQALRYERDDHPDARIAATFVYSDSFRVVRIEHRAGKSFRPISREGLSWGLAAPSTVQPLYAKVKPTGLVFVVEGEGCVDEAHRLGLSAVTSGSATSADRCDWSSLRGRDVVVLPDNDDPGRGYAAAVRDKLAAVGATPRIVELPGLPEHGDIKDFIRDSTHESDDAIRDHVLSLASQAPRSSRLKVFDLDQVEERETEWLWPGRIPLRALTMVGGAQGSTKNFLGYDVIARTTRGWRFPDGGACEAGNVILLEAEENLHESVAPRLRSAGADPRRVKVIESAATGNVDRFVSIVEDAAEIEALAREWGCVRLVVVSPITSYLGSVQQNENEAVRNEIIAPLKRLAENIGCAVVLIKHPSKDHKCNDPLMRIAGAAAWTETMRAAFFVGAEPDSGDEKNPRRALFCEKLSIGPRPDPLAWRLNLDTDPPSIAWLAERPDFTSRESLQGRRKSKAGEKVEAAETFVLEQLERGPMTIGDLDQAAQTMILKGRFSSRSLRDAKSSLVKIGQVVRGTKPGVMPAERWLWLPDRPPSWTVEAPAPAIADDPKP